MMFLPLDVSMLPLIGFISRLVVCRWGVNDEIRGNDIRCRKFFWNIKSEGTKKHPIGDLLHFRWFDWINHFGSSVQLLTTV